MTGGGRDSRPSEKAGKGLRWRRHRRSSTSTAARALAQGKKSLAYHVLLQSENKTLSDQDGAKFLGRLERLLSNLGAELRKG